LWRGIGPCKKRIGQGPLFGRKRKGLHQLQTLDSNDKKKKKNGYLGRERLSSGERITHTAVPIMFKTKHVRQKRSGARVFFLQGREKLSKRGFSRRIQTGAVGGQKRKKEKV